jgi:large subunit ribosomal protein L32
MAVPKKRRSYTRNHKRKSHQALKQQDVSTCPGCGNPRLPHTLCATCGTYKGVTWKSA